MVTFIHQEKGSSMRSSMLAAPLLLGVLLVSARGQAAGEDGGTPSEAAEDQHEQSDASSPKERYLGPCVIGPVQKGKPPRFPPSDPLAPVGYPRGAASQKDLGPGTLALMARPRAFQATPEARSPRMSKPCPGARRFGEELSTAHIGRERPPCSD